jgi:hypothetical protein
MTIARTICSSQKRKKLSSKPMGINMGVEILVASGALSKLEAIVTCIRIITNGKIGNKTVIIGKSNKAKTLNLRPTGFLDKP